jgi:tRNA threonylcarbamoyladenosine biosynthesis protein TsaB
MLILALDTSSPAGSFALLRDLTVLSDRVSSHQQPYSASVLRDTRELLEGAHISLEQIDLFAVDAGPGSFTGLRVGLATVKGWAEVWAKPVAAVSGLEAIAAQVSRSVVAGCLVAAVMDARRGQIFGSVFLAGDGRSKDGSELLDRIGEEVVATADEFFEFVRMNLAGRRLVIACTSAELIRPAIERQGFHGCGIEIVSGVLAPVIGKIGYAKALRGEVVDALHLDANYIRRSDAEMNWISG